MGKVDAILYLVSIFKLDILSLVVHVFCRIKGGDKKKTCNLFEGFNQQLMRSYIGKG